jgi:hypothetical protein
MISQRRINSIDHYLYRDDHARMVNEASSIAIGLGAWWLCSTLQLTQVGSFCVSGALAGVVFLTNIIRYKPASGLEKKGVYASAGGVQTDLRLGFRMRRRLLVQVPLIGAAALCFMIVPDRTEAEVIDRKLRKFLAESRDFEAYGLASDAVHAGIPLSPDVIRAAGSSDFNSMNRGLPSMLNRTALVDCGIRRQARISLPVVYFPEGHGGGYMVGSPLNALWASQIGDGPDKSRIFIAFPGTEGSPALLTYKPPMAADVIISGMSFDGGQTGAGFAAVVPGARDVYVNDVVLSSLTQVVDRVIWLAVEFRKCKVIFDGDWFQMENVRFENCTFEFSFAIPNSMRNKIQETTDSFSFSFSPR